MESTGKIKLISICLTLSLCIMLCCGCDSIPVQQGNPLCRGSKNITQAMAVIDANQNIKPISASGKCTITWYEKNKKRTEAPDIQLRFVPPYNVYFAGSILGQESFRVGLNDNQFWYRVKPTSQFYYGGRIYAQRCRNNHLINPATLLEALGIVSVDDSWEFSKGHYEDILTKKNDKGKPVKKIYINQCSYRISRVEYYEDGDMPLVTTVLGDYTETDGLTVPTQIDIMSHDLDGVSVEIRLRGVKLFEPTSTQLNGKLFKMPSMDGYENIYKLTDNCTFVRE